MKHNQTTRTNGERLALKLNSGAYQAYLAIDPLDLYATTDDPNTARVDVRGGNVADGLTFGELERFLLKVISEC